MSEALEFEYVNDISQIPDNNIVEVIANSPNIAIRKNIKEIASPTLLKETINKFTFYYDPKEITFDSKTRKFLESFRTDDNESCFTITCDDEGLVIY